MKRKAKNLIQATLLIALTVGGIDAQARPGRWADRNDDRIRGREVVDLGDVVVGNSGRRVDASTLDVFSNPRIQCGLTHIKLSASSDSVYLTRIDVEYRDADQYGRNSDSIDLSEDRGPRYGDRRGDDGIYLDSGRSTSWLDVDDVMDGRPNGRCIKSIRVFGIDTPDRGEPGRGRGRGRGGYAGPRGGGYGYGYGNGGEDNYRPASVRVEGLLARPHHEGPHHEAPPVIVPPPRHEEPPVMMPPPPRHEPRRDLNFTKLGTTGLVSKSKPDTRRIDVGMDKGRFDGIKLIAKDDMFEIKYVEVVFASQDRIRKDNIMLNENDTYYLDFDDFSRGRGDRDRAIDQVIIYGDSYNIFGSKAQVEVWGGR